MQKRPSLAEIQHRNQAPVVARRSVSSKAARDRRCGDADSEEGRT
jgi:hypothetical protein